MANFVLLTLGNGKQIRCADLDDAKAKAIYNSDGEYKSLIEITPEGGGPIMSWKIDSVSLEWYLVGSGHNTSS